VRILKVRDILAGVTPMLGADNGATLPERCSCFVLSTVSSVPAATVAQGSPPQQDRDAARGNLRRPLLPDTLVSVVQAHSRCVQNASRRDTGRAPWSRQSWSRRAAPRPRRPVSCCARPLSSQWNADERDASEGGSSTAVQDTHASR